MEGIIKLHNKNCDFELLTTLLDEFPVPNSKYSQLFLFNQSEQSTRIQYSLIGLEVREKWEFGIRETMWRSVYLTLISSQCTWHFFLCLLTNYI